MIIRTKTADIRVVEKVVKTLKAYGIIDVHIMRLPDKKFVIAVLGPMGSIVGMDMLCEVRQSIILQTKNDFWADNFPLFEEAWQFLQNYDNRQQKVGT